MLRYDGFEVLSICFILLFGYGICFKFLILECFIMNKGLISIFFVWINKVFIGRRIMCVVNMNVFNNFLNKIFIELILMF